jgi:hypothetical protein
MSEEVLPTTFDIPFEDLSGAIRKQKCGLHSQQHQKHKEYSQRSSNIVSSMIFMMPTY